MSETSFIVEQLEAGFDGEPWHGPSLRAALEGMPAGEAAAHPVAGAHSVWELVHHVAAWDNVIVERIDGNPLTEPEEGDFPRDGGASAAEGEAAWQALLAKLDASHARLVERIGALSDAELDRPPSGGKYPLRVTLYGTLQHLAYHAAQVKVLRKALAANPPSAE